MNQLYGVVEHGGVTSARGDNREQFLEVLAEQGRGQDRLAGIHPSHISAQGVDLAVVADEAKRVRQLPCGERVGRETLVDETQGADDCRVTQFTIEAGYLRRQQEPLVYDRARGE